jgi:hypothetical protein
MSSIAIWSTSRKAWERLHSGLDIDALVASAGPPKSRSTSQEGISEARFTSMRVVFETSFPETASAAEILEWIDEMRKEK